MPLKPGNEPLPLLESLPLTHEDFVLLALRTGAGCRRRAPPEQPRTETSHSGIAVKLTPVSGDATAVDFFEARATRGDRVTFYWDGDTIVVENHCKHSIL